MNSKKSIREGEDWNISTAAVVDSILRLISRKPKFDRLKLREKVTPAIKRNDLDDDKSVLRDVYKGGYDRVLYEVIENCFAALIEMQPKIIAGKTSLTKTVGIQGIFEFLNSFLEDKVSKSERGLKDVSMTQTIFKEAFKNVDKIDFCDIMFKASSAVGKRRIRDALLVAAGVIEVEDLTDSDLSELLKESL